LVVCIITNKLMLFMTVNLVYYEKRTKHEYTVWAKWKVA